MRRTLRRRLQTLLGARRRQGAGRVEEERTRGKDSRLQTTLLLRSTRTRIWEEEEEGGEGEETPLPDQRDRERHRRRHG